MYWYQDIAADESFPLAAQELAFFASLTDGEGTGDLELIIQSFETGETIYHARRKIELEHRLAIANVYGNLPGIRFPFPGVYAVLLSVDDDIATIRHIRVMEKQA